MFAKVKRGLQKFPPNEGWEMVSDDAKDLLRQVSGEKGWFLLVLFFVLFCLF